MVLVAPNVNGDSNLPVLLKGKSFDEMVRNFELQRDKEFEIPCLRPSRWRQKFSKSLRNEAITLVDPVAFWQAGLCFMEIAF